MFEQAQIQGPVADRTPGRKGKILADNRVRSFPVQLKRKVNEHPASAEISLTQEHSAPVSSPENVVQLVRKKEVHYATGGALGLGLTGAIIGSVVPGIGTGVGALVGATVGAIGGYLFSGSRIYKNLQAHNYQSELITVQGYQDAWQDAKREYEQGTIIRYKSNNSARFTELLHQGAVLYTVDENNQLSIGSGVGVMKHVIVSGNAKVKAAGWARPQYTKGQVNYNKYQSIKAKIRMFEKVKRDNEVKAKKLLSGIGNDFERRFELEDDDQDVVNDYKAALDQLEHSENELQQFVQVNKAQMERSKNIAIQLDNDSGHYHPGRSTGYEAFEAWQAAGFKNLTWKSVK